MNSKVEPHQLHEQGVLIAQHGGEVGRPVLVLVDGPDRSAITVQVSVDDGGDGGKLGNQVHRVLICVLQMQVITDEIMMMKKDQCKISSVVTQVNENKFCCVQNIGMGVLHPMSHLTTTPCQYSDYC